MKTIFRNIIFYTFSLYLISQIFSGLKITGGLQTIALGGVILAAMSIILRPILQVISFPINLLTFGLFSFIINAGLLYLMTRFVPHITVHAFILHSISYRFIHLPKTSLPTYLAFIFLSFMISFLVTIMTWTTKE